MIEVCKSLAGADRLAALIGQFRRGLLPRTGKPPARVRGCFFSRVLEPDGAVAQDWDATLNGATYEGLNAALETVFRGGTQFTSWYIGLINASGFSAVSVNDTMASHGGWTEFTGYTDTTRKLWTAAAASGGVTTNTSVVQFTNGGSTATIQGMFLSTDNTKSGTTGKLWATAAESSPRTLTAGQVFQAYYEVDLTPLS